MQNKFFLSADVCGVVRVWSSTSTPKKQIDFTLDGAISYNSVAEIVDALPTSGELASTTMVAIGLKTQIVELVVLAPLK
jgi:hypothetical protein